MDFITDRFIPSQTKRERTPEGYLVIKDNKFARTGVLQYRSIELPNIIGKPSTVRPTDVIRVFRGPNELFSETVLDSFRSKPATENHPDVLVDTKTFKKDAVGFSKDDLRAEGDYMVGSLVITDQEAIDAIESGKKQISLGYTAKITWAPGKTESGEVYDAIQEDIAGNHIAIVQRGRNGATCKVSDSNTKHITKGDYMSVVIDGITYECPEQTAQAFTKVMDENKELKSTVSTLKDEAEKKDKEIEDNEEEMDKVKDTMQAQIDQLKADADKSKVSDADIHALVVERTKILDAAKSVIKDFDGAELSNDEIKLAVVKDANPNLDVEGKSRDYIEARYDAILDSVNAEPKKSAITSVLGDHAKQTIADGEMVNSTMSLSEKKRQERINNKRG
jgi:hypothetical protein